MRNATFETGLRISFARNQPELQPIVVNGQELEVVHSAKLLHNNKQLVMERSHWQSSEESFQMLVFFDATEKDKAPFQ